VRPEKGVTVFAHALGMGRMTGGALATGSSDIFFVVVASLLVVLAVGWVCLRTLAGGSGQALPVPKRR